LADVDQLLNCFQRHWNLRIDGQRTQTCDGQPAKLGRIACKQTGVNRDSRPIEDDDAILLSLWSRR
jgi:hypothetical protein